MQPLRWTPDDLVFVPDLDEEHQQVFEDAENLRRALSRSGPAAGHSLWLLSKSLTAHLADEEHLMRVSRYPGFQWHESQHDAGRKKLALLTQAIHRNDDLGIRDGFEALVRWLADHVHMADQMMAAHLRNDRRERLAS